MPGTDRHSREDAHLAVERAVLSVILDGSNPARWTTVADLTCEHFASRNHRFVWVAVMRLASRGERINAGSVASEMGGIPVMDCLQAIKAQTPREAIDLVAKIGLDFGASLLGAVGGFNGVSELSADFAPASGLAANAALLRRYRDQRTFQAVLAHYAAESYWPTTRDRVPEIAAEAMAALQGLVVAGSACNMGQALTQALGEAQRAANAREQGDQVPVSWGLDLLDRMCPLRPGRVYVVAAGSGGGKTSLALQAAQATSEASGKAQVAICALEMTAPDLSTIMAGRSLGLSPSAIQDASPKLMESDWRDLRQMAERWTIENTSHVRDLTAEKTNTVESVLGWFAQRHQTTGGLALAVLDYLQLLEPTNPKWTEYQALVHATRAIKQCAVRLQIPIILLAQLNRKGTSALRDKDGKISANPEPSLSDLKGSSSIENDADAVIFLHRPDPNAQGNHIPTRIIIAKQRRGATGAIDVLFRGAHQLFEQIPQPEARASFTSAPSDSEDLMA